MQHSVVPLIRVLDEDSHDQSPSEEAADWILAVRCRCKSYL
jgi:hypothetical protein